MHNVVKYFCGKTVESLWQAQGTTSVRPSTGQRTNIIQSTASWVQPQLIPQSIPRFLLSLSTVKIMPLSLLISQLYTVSTAPITRATKMKFKKGI